MGKWKRGKRSFRSRSADAVPRLARAPLEAEVLRAVRMRLALEDAVGRERS